MTSNNQNNLLFDDLSALRNMTEPGQHLSAKANNDCDCVAYGSTSNRVQIDPEEITRIAGREN